MTSLETLAQLKRRIALEFTQQIEEEELEEDDDGDDLESRMGNLKALI